MAETSCNLSSSTISSEGWEIRSHLVRDHGHEDASLLVSGDVFCNAVRSVRAAMADAVPTRCCGGVVRIYGIIKIPIRSTEL